MTTTVSQATNRALIKEASRIFWLDSTRKTGSERAKYWAILNELESRVGFSSFSDEADEVEALVSQGSYDEVTALVEVFPELAR